MTTLKSVMTDLR